MNQIGKNLTRWTVTLLASLTMIQASANTHATTEPETTSSSESVNVPLLDPTQPNWFGLKKKQQVSGRLVLNSLVKSPQRRIAVINGELMREGETKRGITVEQILDDRVLVVTKSGKKRALKLKGSSGRINRKTRSRATNTKGKTR